MRSRVIAEAYLTRGHDLSYEYVTFAEQSGGIVSTQVLQEFYVNVTRKIPSPLAPTAARGILGTYAAWHRQSGQRGFVAFPSWPVAGQGAGEHR